MWTHYNAGVRTFCGHELPEGLKKNQRLERPILTPATKAPMGQHDVSASRDEILGSKNGGGIDAKDFDRFCETCCGSRTIGLLRFVNRLLAFPLTSVYCT